jgi:hypothetical protein
MNKNTDYNAKVTLSKGGEQFLNILSSSVFSALIAVVLKHFTDKEFTITDIQEVIKNISGLVVLMTPAVSALIRMINNFRKNYFLQSGGE